MINFEAVYVTYSSTEQNKKGGLWPSYGTEDKSRGRALYLLSSSAFVAPNANYMSTVHVLYRSQKVNCQKWNN